MFNLFFSAIIWVLFTIILLSNRKSSINRWCFGSGMLFSIGVFKEYLFFTLAPFIAAHSHLGLTVESFKTVYSILTSVLYFTAAPSMLFFSLHFSGYPARKPRAMRRLEIMAAALCLILMVIFTPAHTYEFQRTSLEFWIICTAYNLAYIAASTAVMIRAVKNEKYPKWKRQKTYVLCIVAPPVWYWFISIFIIHTLRIEPLFQLWMGNAAIMLALLIFYIFVAFREGAMGLKLNYENYKWNSDASNAALRARYLSHTVKNEVVKIEWCAENLSKLFPGDVPSEIAIINRSVDNLKHFIDKSYLYLGDISLEKENCRIGELIRAQASEAQARAGEAVRISVSCGEDEVLPCDPRHVSEAIANIIGNAVDAVGGEGNVKVSYKPGSGGGKFRGRYNVISIEDDGEGVDPENLPHLFDHYFTTKASQGHIGLGLFYCARVMEVHGGFVKAESHKNSGMAVSLFFPYGSGKHG